MTKYMSEGVIYKILFVFMYRLVSNLSLPRNWKLKMQGNTEVALAVKVERMIEMICYEQCQPPPDADASKILASISQDNIHILSFLKQESKLLVALLSTCSKITCPNQTHPLLLY